MPPQLAKIDRRSNFLRPAPQIDATTDGIRGGNWRGKVIMVQRHGETSKNVALRPAKRAYEASLQKLLGNSSEKAAAEEVEAILSGWSELSNRPNW